jgi:hypothetical protein
LWGSTKAALLSCLCSEIDERKEVLRVDGAATAWGVAMADLDQRPATPPSRGNREDGGRPREDSGRVGGPRQSRAVQGVARGTDSPIGRGRALAESIDDDLWILYPECRYEFPVGEKSVRQWRDAVSALESLSIAVESLNNGALQHAIGDTHERAIEALRRARQRAQETSAQ